MRDLSQAAIFGPVLALMLLTCIVWVYMYAKRIPFIQSLDTKANDITPSLLAQRSPPSVSNPSDNLKNLFEVPVLFYALSSYLFVTGSVDSLYVIGSWLFVLLRVLHSAIHCTINIVMIRFIVYVLSSVILFAMIFRAAIGHFV